MANYTVITLDLATAITAQRLVPEGQTFYQVTVLAISPGAVCSLQFGSSGSGPVTPHFVGESWVALPRGETNGLFFTNPAAQSTRTLVLFVGFAPTAESSALLHTGAWSQPHKLSRYVFWPTGNGLSIAASALPACIASLEHTAAALKRLKVRHCWVAIESSTAAASIRFRFARCQVPAPGGTPITPAPVLVTGPVTEATAKLNPTPTLTTDYVGHIWNLGITGAAPTTAPPPPLNYVDAINLRSGDPDDQGQLLELPAGVAAGFGLFVASSVATTLVVHNVWDYTEE